MLNCNECKTEPFLASLLLWLTYLLFEFFLFRRSAFIAARILFFIFSVSKQFLLLQLPTRSFAGIKGMHGSYVPYCEDSLHYPVTINSYSYWIKTFQQITPSPILLYTYIRILRIFLCRTHVGNHSAKVICMLSIHYRDNEDSHRPSCYQPKYWNGSLARPVWVNNKFFYVSVPP